jgi:hypothetical protein
MKKIAIVPFRFERYKETPVFEYLTSAGWEVCPVVGASSIFEAFSNTIKEKDIRANDKIILCHDDIKIISNPQHFNETLDYYFEKDPSVGFLGVAGTTELNSNAIWWEGASNPHPESRDKLSGMVIHGSTQKEYYYTYFGPLRKVAVLDGVFLATKGSVLHSIQTKKPKSFKGDWDFYDLFYTTQATLKNLNNYTVPIQIAHESYGNTAGKESWHQNRASFQEMYSFKFPIKVTSTQ